MAEDEDDKARTELDNARKQADPSRGTEKVDRGHRANVTDVDEGAGVKTADKKL